MKKVLIVILAMVVMCSAVLIGCDPSEEWWKGLERPTFKEMCVTTEDGFVYYLDDEIGLCIIELPDSEEVTIPEYIDGHRVMQLGYEEIGFMYMKTHVVDGNHVRKLTVQHTPFFYYTSFQNLETIVYIDYFYMYSSDKAIQRISKGYAKEVELRKGEKPISLDEIIVSVFEIPEYVVKIDEGVFDGFKNVTIKTSYESKPDGWEEGWNGNCEVIWGVELN